MQRMVNVELFIEKMCWLLNMIVTLLYLVIIMKVHLYRMKWLIRIVGISCAAILIPGVGNERECQAGKLQTVGAIYQSLRVNFANNMITARLNLSDQNIISPLIVQRCTCYVK